MKVACQLKRRGTTEPATALLLRSHDIPELLRLCAHLGCDPLPAVFAVADGFLLKLPQPRRDSVPGVLRLRALADDLLVPVDAELVPALLHDEARALVGHRGLVILPGGRVLEYAKQPLSLSHLIRLPLDTSAHWQAFPDSPVLPDAITEITLDRPDPSADDVLAPGGEDIGVESPRPEGTGLPSRALGRVAYGMGRGLAWLGTALSWRGLARAGANLMNNAMSLVPRLSESLFGRQEASLRELLKYFHDGDIDKALRHAVPINKDPQRGGQPGTGSSLPNNDPFYSLRSLLGNSGPAGWWHSSADTFWELEREYRKQAEKAAREGDYRRAAFIYGMLLTDFRAAALALAQGGLHRDAAILYQSKLHDLRAAAREFEAAGDTDRALQLYRDTGEHLLAGDLLRRLGEEELALVEFQIAADKLVRAGDHYQAGELMFHRGRRPDLARPYYIAGWAQRPAGSSAACVLRLAHLYAADSNPTALMNLVQEADDFYAAPGNNKAAADFYNDIVLLARRPGLEKIEPDVRDLALLGLANKMEQRVHAGARPGEIVSLAMGTAPAWAPPVVRDAQVALARAVRRKSAPAAQGFFVNLIPGRKSLVSAVCQAPHSGDLFVGFDNGDVIRFQPERGEIVTLTNENAPILSLATNPPGKTLLALSGRDREGQLSSFSWSLGFRMVNSLKVVIHETAWLCPMLANDGDDVVGLWDGEEMHLRYACSLLPRFRPVLDSYPDVGLLFPVPPPYYMRFLYVSNGHVQEYPCHASPQKKVRSAFLYWNASLPPGCSLRNHVFAFLHTSPNTLQLAGVGAGGEVCLSTLRFHEDSLVATTASIPGRDPYLAATLIRLDQVAAVTKKGVHWLRRRGSTLQAIDATPIALPDAIACFAHHRSGELLVVCSDGRVARLPLQ